MILIDTCHAQAYEACNRMRMPLHTPKTLKMWKKKPALFD